MAQYKVTILRGSQPVAKQAGFENEMQAREWARQFIDANRQSSYEVWDFVVQKSVF